ncbi:MAG TPA: T9SS type A sorting domain-containing protein [Saprospiraceae bacterium]
MKTHKSLLILISCLFSLDLLHAQQVYESHHYGSPGDIYLYNRFAPGLLNDAITQDGPSVTWDVSSMATLNTHVNQILEPGEAINQFNFLTICALSGLSTFDCFEIWDNTDQAVQLKDSLILLDFILHDLQRFQSREGDLLLENFIGFTVDLGGTPTQAVIVYENQDTIMHFPINYADAWTSQTRYGLDLTSVGQNIIYNSTQSRITTIDGWGTVQTPFDTFENVIRLRSEILRLDTIVQDGTDTTTLIADQIEYMWLDTNYSLPIMTANGLITPNDSVILNAVEYVYEASCPLPTWSLDAGSQVFEIDTSGTVTVDFTILNNNADIFSWDFGDGQFITSNGDTSHTYNEPGVYSIAVAGCMTDCLPLNSCSFQILSILIVDSTTAITHIDGMDIGIKLYPNPAQEHFNLFIPADLGKQHFRIADMTGRTLQTGVINEGETRLATDLLANGLYSIQFTSITKPNDPIAITRFMIMKE